MTRSHICARGGMPKRFQLAYALAVCIAVMFCGPARADSSNNVRKLMVQPGSFTPFPHHRPRLHMIKAENSSGGVINVPAMAVNVYSGVLSWDNVESTKVKKFESQLPESVRSHVSLFYTNSLGWIVVPRGWHLHWAAEGADGNSSIAFVSPKGWKHGWLYEGTVPACLGCIWDSTRGLIPAAYKTVGKDYEEFSPPAPTLVPLPENMAHPNRCAAIFSYQSKPSEQTIRAIVQLNTSGDPWEREIYVAASPSQAEVVSYILKRFRAAKPRPVCATR